MLGSIRRRAAASEDGGRLPEHARATERGSGRHCDVGDPQRGGRAREIEAAEFLLGHAWDVPHGNRLGSAGARTLEATACRPRDAERHRSEDPEIPRSQIPTIRPAANQACYDALAT